MPFIVLQTGIISDDELLDLLDLALSSNTSNMVIRARELMRSRIDPLQLISQLANLIMDILAGKCELDSSEIRRRFSDRHVCNCKLTLNSFIGSFDLCFSPISIV